MGEWVWRQTFHWSFPSLVRLSLILPMQALCSFPSAVLILPLRLGQCWIWTHPKLDFSSLPSRPLFQNVSPAKTPRGSIHLPCACAHSRAYSDCSRSGESWRDEQQKQQRKPRCLFWSVATPVCMIAKEVVEDWPVRKSDFALSQRPRACYQSHTQTLATRVRKVAEMYTEKAREAESKCPCLILKILITQDDSWW